MTTTAPVPEPVRRSPFRIGADRRGVAMLEFAFSLPLVLGIGLYATETANLALANLRISQIANNLADNASRVGGMTVDNTKQLREIDMNDVLTATRLQGAPWDLTTRGRIIVSSLEEKSGKQVIHWQRCLGTQRGAGWDSQYGTTTPTDGTDTTTANDGTIVTGLSVQAPPSSGVMLVEVNYLYKPVVTGSWLPGGAANIRYVASFIVRDRRVFTQIFNPAPAATRMTCNLYTAA